jgi:putative transcriptional regulator
LLNVQLAVQNKTKIGDLNMKNNLSKIMGERRITAVTIAKDTKISRTTIRAIYYEEAENVKLSTLTKICDYLNCPLSELIEYNPCA